MRSHGFNLFVPCYFRVELLLASQDTSDKSQVKLLQQKDSTIATMSQSLRQQETEILSIENKYNIVVVNNIE